MIVLVKILQPFSIKIIFYLITTNNLTNKNTDSGAKIRVY